MISFKQYLEESRSAPLYHALPYDSYKEVMRYNELRAETIHKHDRVIPKSDKNYIGVVSLTRSLPFAIRWGVRKSEGEPFVVMELDQRKLTQRYKIVPYNHFQDSQFNDRINPTARELNDVRKSSKFPINQYEENVIGDIKNVKDYLVRVHYPVKFEKKFKDFKKFKEMTLVPITSSQIKKVY